MSKIAHLLVHGYLGSTEDFASIVSAIQKQTGDNEVDVICLPGHDQDTIPSFDETVYLERISTAIDRCVARGQDLILIGHSTGGSLLLTELRRRRNDLPDSLDRILLLVLCATPPKLDPGYAERWEKHRLALARNQEPALHDIGALAGMIRRLRRSEELELGVPILVVHGEEDELVPCFATDDWSREWLGGPLRVVRVPGARHNLFQGEGAAMTQDILLRALTDARLRRRLSTTAANPLFGLMPDMERYVDAWPDSFPHLANAPAGCRVTDRVIEHELVTRYEPTQANIEITTRCTLGCRACARTQLKLRSRHMSKAVFSRVLNALPHAWRVVLVGLGEPLLHPQVLDFIQIAVSEGRHVALVTNAMQLDHDMAHALCTSGMASLTFSIDAVNSDVAREVRAGSDMELIKTNILRFMEVKDRLGAAIGTSVFTALGAGNYGELHAVIDFSLQAGIDALMISDLNFAENQATALHAGLQPDQATIMRREFRRALASGLPVLSVWGLEEYALDERYLDYLLLDGRQLASRSSSHAHCYSPWQTIPVNVDGQVTICDCQPRAVLGELLKTPLQSLWNGGAMQQYRRRMLGDQPPDECLSCPRF